ncbi:spherulation-specific family 4 protein [Ottowia sp.]|uniref:spherulation-specific family 4 protein n=1 Tax=Ottowia sp. TaxID=1898956 RepID=UPI002C06771F|nr:spherulation-specific family 4 protein [Ottowia sp.]
MPTPSRCRLTTLACLLALSATLTACGGGADTSGEATAPPSPPPSGTFQLVFASPTSADNVREVNTPVPLDLRMTLNGAPAPDNVNVDLSATSASVTPARTTTGVGGHAVASLVGSSAGTVAINAAVSGRPEVKTALTLYLRPAPRQLEVLVPAYFSTGRANSPWIALSAGQQSFPDVRITAILNPSDGLFDRPDPSLVSAAADFISKGGKLIGYVLTGYGNGGRSLADIQANVDAYVTHYGTAVSGIFLDEVDNTPKKIAFYQSVSTDIRRRRPSFRIVSNPGTYPDAGYAALADTVTTFEGQAVTYFKTDPQPDNTWVYQHDNGAQAMLVHDASCADMQKALRAAASARNNTGVVYVTDLHYNPATGSGNPWANLPSYWMTFLATVDAINKSQALPAC